MNCTKLREKITSDLLLKVLGLIFISAIIALIAAFTAYFINFDREMSSDQFVWGAFGDYVGGTLGPILSFLALMALILTIVLQNKQIEISQNSLRDAKEQLKRSEEFQEASLLALQEQINNAKITAKLTAINHMIANINEELLTIPTYRGPGSENESRFITLTQKKESLIQQLESIQKNFRP